MLSLTLVPALALSSAALFVLSCSLAVSSGPDELLSALTASSPSEASSGFQWPWPFFCLAMESCLCLSKSTLSSALLSAFPLPRWTCHPTQGTVSAAKRGPGERRTVRGLLEAQCPGGGECARGRGRGEGAEGEHVAGERHCFLRSIDVLGSFGFEVGSRRR
jgi:hypothetical protein